MTTFGETLGRVPLSRVNERSREIHFWRTVLTVLAGLLFALGWLTAKGFGVVWLAVAWSSAAVVVGWQEGRRNAPRPNP